MIHNKYVIEPILKRGFPDRDFRDGDIVRHFKGNLYRIISCTAVDTETNQRMAVYQSIQGTGAVWVRPYEMFISRIDEEKYPEEYKQFEYRVTKVRLVPESDERNQTL